MSIYAGNKKAKLYKGDYHPAQFIKGNIKLAGYEVLQKQGADLSFEGSYKDNFEGFIYGKSIQNGVPSKAAPIAIESSSNFDFISEGRNMFDSKTLYQRYLDFAPESIDWVSDNISWQGRNNCLENRQLGITVNTVWFKTFKANTQYTFICDFWNNGTFDGISISFLYTDGSLQTWSNSELKKWQTCILKSEPNKTIKTIKQSYSSTQKTYIDKDSVYLYEGTENKSYQPYYAVKANITDKLYGIKADSTASVYSYIDENGEKWISDFYEITKGRVFINRLINGSLLDNTKPLNNQSQALLASPSRSDITSLAQAQSLLKVNPIQGHTHIYTNAAVLPFIKANVKVTV